MENNDKKKHPCVFTLTQKHTNIRIQTKNSNRLCKNQCVFVTNNDMLCQSINNGNSNTNHVQISDTNLKYNTLHTQYQPTTAITTAATAPNLSVMLSQPYVKHETCHIINSNNNNNNNNSQQWQLKHALNLNHANNVNGSNVVILNVRAPQQYCNTYVMESTQKQENNIIANANVNHNPLTVSCLHQQQHVSPQSTLSINNSISSKKKLSHKKQQTKKNVCPTKT